MNQTITQTVLETTENRERAVLYRIPNNTNDYIELTNYGCALKSICIHDRQGRLRNILLGGRQPEEDRYPTGGQGLIRDHLSPALSSCLSHKLWQTQEVGENYVFLSCQVSEGESGLPTALTFGTRIMWVNRNRLIIDLFASPERDACFAPAIHLALRLAETDGYTLRTFCPQIVSGGQTLPAENTAYANMAFVPLAEESPVFLSSQEEVKPMAELASSAAGLTVSAYGNLDSLWAKRTPESGAALCQAMLRGITLKRGESFAGRVIYGFDHLYSPDEPESQEPSPFSVFL